MAEVNSVVVPEIAELRERLRREAASTRKWAATYVTWAAEQNDFAQALEEAASTPGPLTPDQVAAMIRATSQLAGLMPGDSHAKRAARLREAFLVRTASPRRDEADERPA